ncbi:diphthamide synthesis protein [Candidatus Woesearchaeota archaeon]|nr:diphthamide synthesis protein [Candidatus Woesearchaeota archaeon]
MVEMVFVDATWEQEIVLGKDLLRYFEKEKVKSVGLFASVQFLKLEKVREQLQQSEIRVHETKAKRTHLKTQILGCDAYHDSFEEDIIATSDAVLYIGDGLFHPKALLLAQTGREIKPVVIWDPVSEKMKIITQADIEKQLNKKKANLKKFLAADVVGVMVTVKPGQQYMKNALFLKQVLEKKGKKVYLFLGDTFDYRLFENYPFVQVWVNTACPRIGTDDITEMQRPLINIREAYDAEKTLEEMGK